MPLLGRTAGKVHRQFIAPNFNPDAQGKGFQVTVRSDRILGDAIRQRGNCLPQRLFGAVLDRGRKFADVIQFIVGEELTQSPDANLVGANNRV